MPIRTVLAAILEVLVVLPAAAWSQQPSAGADGALVGPRSATMSVAEPRRFPPGGPVEAKRLPPPLVSARTPHAVQPPVNFRLVSSEELARDSAARPPRKLAPRSTSAKPPLAKPIVPTAGTAIGTVGGSLAIVLGVFLVIAWCARRVQPGASSVLPKEAVEVLGRVPLAGRQQLHLVRVGSKLVLVAMSPADVVALTEITDPLEIEQLCGLCRRGSTTSASAAFREALQQLSHEPAASGFVAAASPAARHRR